MCQGFGHFSGFLHNFVLANLATSSIRVRAFKPSHVCFHWIALAEYSQMSSHVPGFQSFFSFFCNILYWPLATSSVRVKAFNSVMFVFIVL